MYIFIALSRDTPLAHICRIWSDGHMAILICHFISLPSWSSSTQFERQDQPEPILFPTFAFLTLAFGLLIFLNVPNQTFRIRHPKPDVRGVHMFFWVPHPFQPFGTNFLLFPHPLRLLGDSLILLIKDLLEPAEPSQLLLNSSWTRLMLLTQ